MRCDRAEPPKLAGSRARCCGCSTPEDFTSLSYRVAFDPTGQLAGRVSDTQPRKRMARMKVVVTCWLVALVGTAVASEPPRLHVRVDVPVLAVATSLPA